MVKNIVRDPMFLMQKSEPATEADKKTVEDLLDTLNENRDRCVGMAANMIGVRKRIIVVAAGPFVFPLIVVFVQTSLFVRQISIRITVWAFIYKPIRLVQRCPAIFATSCYEMNWFI